MPASLTHFTFVKNNTSINEYSSLCYLGGQGPDVFFFYGYTYKKRNNPKIVQNFGGLLHHCDIAPCYLYLIDYANKSEHKDMLFAFIEGLFAHYILDRNVHPYVFYRTGFTSNLEEKNKYLLSHVGFETILDVVYSKKMSTFRNPKKCIKCPKKWVKVVSEMFASLAKQLNYDGIDKNTYYLAYLDMNTALGALYSPLGIKKAYLNKFKHLSMANAMSMPKSTTKYTYIDVLNEKKSAWASVVDNTPHHESVDELIFNASKELDYIKELLFEAQKNKDIKADLNKFVHNINHDGIDNAASMKYFILCWEHPS